MLLEPLPTPDIVQHRIPDPFRAGDDLRMRAAYCDEPIANAGGRVVGYCGYTPDKVRVADGLTMYAAGVILDGYGDIPAGKPFWITCGGPSVARSAQTSASTCEGCGAPGN